MTHNFKKDYGKNWDLPQINEQPMSLMENDDDQDIYISERSSVASSNDLSQIVTPIGKRLPTPTTSTVLSIPQKQPQILRYPPNESTENGIYQQQKKQAKKKKNDPRKPVPNHGNLIALLETKPSEHSENYYPSWYNHKVQSPPWIMHHRQTTSYDTLDSLQHNHQAAFTSSSIKPQQPSRKKYVPPVHSNQDKQRFDHLENNSLVPTHSTTHENHEINHQKRRSSPKAYVPYKDVDHDEHRMPASKTSVSQPRRKVKFENNWTENYGPSISNGRISQGSNNLMITSNSLANGRKNRSKLSEKNSMIYDLDENAKSRAHPQPHVQNQTRSHNAPSIPFHQTHHHHLHVRRRPPSGSYLDSDVHVVDVAFRKADRSSYVQQIRDPFHSPMPPVSNQTTHLPLIMPDHHQQKIHSPRFPTEYYGALARQAHGRNWDDTSDTPRIYKPDPQTRFYDRYLHHVVDKRLAA